MRRRGKKRKEKAKKKFPTLKVLASVKNSCASIGAFLISARKPEKSRPIHFWHGFFLGKLGTTIISQHLCSDRRTCGGVRIEYRAHGLIFKRWRRSITCARFAGNLLSQQTFSADTVGNKHGQEFSTAFGALGVAEFSVPHTVKIATSDHRGKLISLQPERQRKSISKGWIQRKAVISVIHSVWFKYFGFRESLVSRE